MEDIRLPRHVIDRLEHRWASRLQQAAKYQVHPMQARHVQMDGSQTIPVVVRRAANRSQSGYPGGRDSRPNLG
jgi:hypothetical protein